MSVAICWISLLGVAKASYSGIGTAYSKPYDMDSTGENMCEFKATSLPDRWQQYFAAINEAQWDDGDNCGRCIKVKGAGGSVIVYVVDQCPDWACDEGNLDFSTVVSLLSSWFPPVAQEPFCVAQNASNILSYIPYF